MWIHQNLIDITLFLNETSSLEQHKPVHVLASFSSSANMTFNTLTAFQNENMIILKTTNKLKIFKMEERANEPF